MVWFVPQARYTDPTERWEDAFWLDFRGCRPATPGAPVEARRELEAGSAPHVLWAHCEGPAGCAGTASVSYRCVPTAATAALVVLSLLVVSLALPIAADRWDRARIRAFVEERGGRVERITWRAFGRGWFGERGERVYAVEFRDADGARREATFKTSLFSGVWTDALPGPRAAEA